MDHLVSRQPSNVAFDGEATGMKLLVFAHVPPPHHGQAVMVELMLRGLGGVEWRVASGERQKVDRGRRVEIAPHCTRQVPVTDGKGRDVRPRASANVDDLPQRDAEDAKYVEWRGRDGDPSPSDLSDGEEETQGKHSEEFMAHSESPTRNPQPVTRNPQRQRSCPSSVVWKV
jgi:hypothetical protein